MTILAKLGALSILAKACAGLALALALSGWLNLALYGKLAAKDAECEAEQAKAVLKALQGALDERREKQDGIDLLAAAEREAADQRMTAAANRAAAAARKLEGLIREQPLLAVDAPDGDCFLPASWVRASDDAVHSATAARP